MDLFPRTLYIKKKNKQKNWSNILDRQFKELLGYYGNGIELFEIDTSSLWKYFQSMVKLFSLMRKNPIEVLYVNHLICGIACIPSLHLVSRSILALHESEQVLGWPFAIKNIGKLPIKHLFRYSNLFALPKIFFKELLVLSNSQIPTNFLRKKCTHLNYLGIEVERFDQSNLPKKRSKQTKIFFPHDPKRPDKGYKYARKALDKMGLNIQIATGGNYNFTEMVDQFFASDIILITTIYETYSLVLLEAMAANRYIIVTNTVGLIEFIKTRKNENDLREMGLFITELDSDSIANSIQSVIEKLNQNIIARTKMLLQQLELDEQSANKRLFDHLLNS